MLTFLNVKRENGIAHIELNRPDKLNALSNEMVEELISELKNIEKDATIKVVILTGAGKSFCAGGDLEAMDSFTNSPEVLTHVEKALNLTTLLLDYDKYVISAVHGYAAGAGFSLALASDFIVAHPSAKFGLNFVNVGLIPDLGLMKLLTQRVSLPIVKEWVVSGKVLTAEEAKKYGILNRISEKDLMSDTIEFAEFLLKGPPLSNKFVKYMLNHVMDADWKSVMMQETIIQTLLLQTNDKNEGVRAFLENRKPIFTGS